MHEAIPASLKDWSTEDLIDELEQRDPEWLKGHAEFQAALADRDHFKAGFEDYRERIRAASFALSYRTLDELGAELEDERWADGLKRANSLAVTSESTGEEPGTTDTAKRLRMPPTPTGRADTSAQAKGRQVGTPPQGLNQAGHKMLDMLDRIAPARVTWASLAAMCGYKPRGGNFNAARKAMRESGRMVEEGEFVRSSQPPTEGMTREQARQLWKEVLDNPAPEMIDALHVKPMTRQALADFLGKAPRGGHWNGGVAQLLRNGVAVETSGRLELARPLPGESR